MSKKLHKLMRKPGRQLRRLRQEFRDKGEGVSYQESGDMNFDTCEARSLSSPTSVDVLFVTRRYRPMIHSYQNSRRKIILGLVVEEYRTVANP